MATESHLDADLERRFTAEELPYDDDWGSEDLQLAGEEEEYGDD